MIGYISDNILLPILDFFYGLVPSYGLAIIALTVVIRLALFPLSAGSIRNARRMRIAQPVMQQRQAEIRSKFANNPSKQQEEMGKLMKEFGSPLAGCLPLLVQMPILFALFATLRGSPFADVPYNINVKVLPAGVLLYMVVANIFQALQTFLLIREPLPDNLQTILEQQLANQTVAASATAVSAERLPFEPKGKR